MVSQYDECDDQAERLISLVRLEGFEPPTLGSVDRCSNPLSYSRSDTRLPIVVPGDRDAIPGEPPARRRRITTIR